MKKNLGISISIGLISGIWVFIAGNLGLPSWAGFIGWSVFFFAGGNFKACKKSFTYIVLGAILAYLTVHIQTVLNTSGVTSALVIVIFAFTMTIAQSFSIFSMSSATFVGCNIYFASGSLFHTIVVTSIDLIIALVSVKFGAFLDPVILKGKFILIKKDNFI